MITDFTIVARYSHVASGWHVSLDSGIAGVRFATHQSGAQQSTTSSLFAYPANAWTHGVVSRSGAAAKIYFNGHDVTNSAGTHIDPASHSGSAQIGTWPTVGVSGTTLIDGVRVYSRAISPSEAVALYTDSLAGHPQTLNRVRRPWPYIPAAGGGGGHSAARRFSGQQFRPVEIGREGVWVF